MAAAPVIAVGLNQAFREGILAKFDSAGNTYPHGHGADYFANFSGKVTQNGYCQGPHALATALDGQGNTYQAGNMSFTYDPAVALETYGYLPFTLVKANPDGDVLWTASHGAAVTDMTIDASGNVYTVGDAVNATRQVWSSGSRAGYYTTRKYDPSGNLLWSADHGFSPSYVGYFFRQTIHLGADGYLYTGGSWNSSTGNLTRYDPDTGEILSQTLATGTITIQDLVVDAASNAYILGTGSYAVAKYDLAGTLLASAPVKVASNGDKHYPRRIAFDSGGNLVILTDAPYINYLSQFLFRYDTDCLLLHEQTPYDSLRPWRDMALDADDRVYLVAKSYGTPAYVAPTVVQFDADFDLVWQNATALWGKGDAISVAVSEVETPSLRLSISLGVPTISGDQYVLAPGLPLAIALGVPRIVRDYLGPPLPAVWRVRFLDAPDLALALKSIQLSADIGETRITLVVALPSAALSAALETLVGSDIELLRGVRFGDGSEQLDVLATATLATTTVDIGSSSASATLTATRATPASSGQTRRILGISYRNTRDGRRRIRGAVDTYLLPGDSADLGNNELMTVAEISIYVSPTSATMEIAE